MANNSVPASSQNKKYCVKFYHLWCKKFKFIQKSWKGEGFVLRTVCGSDFSMAYGGKNDINRLGRRKYPFKHMGYVDAVQRQRKLTDFVASSAKKFWKLNCFFLVFWFNTTSLLSTANFAAKLFRNRFPDFKILYKYQCGRTKTTHILTEKVAIQFTSELKEKLFLTRCYELATDGTSDMKMINFPRFSKVCS